MPQRAVVGLHFEIRRVHRIGPSWRRIISLRRHYQRRGAQSPAKRQARLDHIHNPPPLITLAPLSGLVVLTPTSTTRRSGGASHKSKSNLSVPYSNGRFGSKAVGIGPSRSAHGMRVQVRAVDFCRANRGRSDEADNRFSNCLGFTHFLRPEVGKWCALGCDESSRPACIRCHVRMRPSVRFFVCASSTALL